MKPLRPEAKVKWAGLIIGVQPRIRLTRSFDQRYHEYLGYVLSIETATGENSGSMEVGVGPGTHDKFQFRVGGVAQGGAMPVADPDRDIVQLH